ncbi:MAG: DUF2029 domain-containing protein [Candidatus Dormibacteraeota bacterium]|nr:DUF2029 domain-containing protein [Candidatus Dormibacteraeota bacterium]
MDPDDRSLTSRIQGPEGPAARLSWSARRRVALASAWACVVAFADLLKTAGSTRRPAGLFNDFYTYWAAARILGRGGDPYDINLVNHVLRVAGVHSTVGAVGYSYPLLLAELLRPLALLPPRTAAILFTAASLAAFGVAMYLLLEPLSRAATWELLLLATGAGLFAPVNGSLYFGQVNLIVLSLLALAFHRIVRPGALAVASAIKLYPAVALAAFGAQGRRAFRPLLGALTASLLLIVVPNLSRHQWRYEGTVGRMLQPDTFWTNQSLNGFFSRLSLASQWTRPPLPGLAVTGPMLVVCALFGLLAVGVIGWRRGNPWDAGFALLLCLGVVIAPGNSLWNFTPLLVAIAYCWPRVRVRPPELAVLLTGYVLVEAQGQIDVVRDSFYGGRPAMTWLASLALYGALLIAGLTVYLLVKARPTSWEHGTAEHIGHPSARLPLRDRRDKPIVGPSATAALRAIRRRAG